MNEQDNDMPVQATGNGLPAIVATDGGHIIQVNDLPQTAAAVALCESNHNTVRINESWTNEKSCYLHESASYLGDLERPNQTMDTPSYSDST